MKKVLLQGFSLVLIIFRSNLGVQTESMQVKRFISSDSTIAKLEYRVTLFQDSFFLYSPVGIHLWVKNLSYDTAQVWFDQTQGWILQDQDKKVYDPTMYIEYTGPQTIRPGDSIGGLANLSDYGVRIPGPCPSPALPIGDYKVYYKIGSDSTAPLTFRVIAPQGEESKALALFLDAFSPINRNDFYQTLHEERKKLYNEYVRKLLNFVDHYPKSVYAISALRRALIGAWTFHDYGIALLTNERIMKEYPEANHNGFLYLRLYYQNDPARFRSVLDSIIKSNPHPRIMAGAKKTLEDLEREKR